MKKAIYILLFILFTTLLLSVVSISYAETFGDLVYSVSYNGYVSINSCKENVKELTIPSAINGNPVIAIGENAFGPACFSLKTVTIPESVVYIHENAFRECHHLESVTVADGNFAYRSENGVLIDKLKSMLVVYPEEKSESNYKTPDNVLIIGEEAFSKNEHITQVDIADGTELVFAWAFSGCKNLRNVKLPDSIRVIEEGAFHNCETLTEIALPNLIRKIYPYTFKDCTALQKVTMFDTVAFIKEQAFSGCNNLTDFTISGGIIGISEKAFYNCLALAEIRLPDSYVMTIASDAFYNCPNLTVYAPHDSAAEEELKANRIMFSYSD